jgi:hypothetical protein
LFVTDPLVGTSQRVWVVLSSVAPEETTIFWLERSDGGYRSGLVYDSFNKGVIQNEPRTAIATVTAVRIESSSEILLEELLEPGSRRNQRGAAGRVFQVKIEGAMATVTLRDVSLPRQ